MISAEELARVLVRADRERPVLLKVDRSVLITVIAGLQLALRHPNYNVPSAMVVQDFIRQVT